MSFESFKTNILQIFSTNVGLPTLQGEEIEKLYRLTEIMLEVNKSMNLTAITEERAVILKHYADSLTVSAMIPQNAKVIDVGCGAGFPTLPLAIIRPDISITALDGTAKRIEYVRSTAEKLGLTNVKAISARAEELGSSDKLGYRESFDIVTARAVATARTVYTDARNFPKPSGCFILYKTPEQLKEDLPEIRSCASHKNWKVTEIFELPDSAGSRQFLFY